VTEQLVRIGPVDDWVRTVAHHLRTDVVPVGPDRADLDRWLTAGRPLLVSADVPGLNAILTRLVRRELAAHTPIGWVPDPDRSSRELAAALHLPARPTLAANIATSDAVRPVRLVRDDHGGLLLLRGTLTAASGRRFGVQSYHDDALIADGPIRRIEVGPDYTDGCAVHARVKAGLRRRAHSTGRSVQSACAEAVVTIDGVRRERPVTKWTWYADPRQHWLLRAPAPPA